MLIRISLGDKFQLKLTVLIFCAKLAKDGYLKPRKRKNEHH